MKGILQLALCGCLAAGLGMAQRGGGHGGGGGGMRGGGGGGGMRGGGGGGGMRGGGGMSHGFSGGGYRGGGGFSGGGYGGGYYGHGNGYRGGYYGGRYGYYGGWRGGYGWPYWSYPSFGFGYSYWPGYYDYGYDYSYPSYSYPSYTYPAYQPVSNVSVVYPQIAQATPSTVYVNPVLRQYDEYGQEVPLPAASANNSPQSSGSPLYLIAFRDQSIRAAVAYWVNGKTLHYVTQQHEEKQAPVDTLDRDFTLRLNRERHVQFSLPAAQ